MIIFSTLQIDKHVCNISQSSGLVLWNNIFAPRLHQNVIYKKKMICLQCVVCERNGLVKLAVVVQTIVSLWAASDVSLSFVSVSFKNFSLLFSLPSPLQINVEATSESQPPTTSLRPDTPRLIPLLRDACGWSRRLVLTSGSSSTSTRILIWRTGSASTCTALLLYEKHMCKYKRSFIQADFVPGGPNLIER